MTDSKKHWMRPLKGKWRGGRHLLLWPNERQHGQRVTATAIDAILVEMMADATVTGSTHTYDTVDQLDDVLDKSCAEKGTLTIWIPGGWDHFVLTGLAELVDRGAITWRYVNLESHKVMLRGQWRGRKIIITSLAAWTGGTWDQWASKTNLKGADLFRASFSAIASLCRKSATGTVAPTASAAGMLVWRSWMGPRVCTSEGPKGARPRSASPSGAEWVTPIPSRPQKAREAERHCTYGLVQRQFGEGLVEGPIYCLDVAQCYLLGLVTTPLPIMFRKKLHRPSIGELMDGFAEGTGAALVQITSPERPYPVRRAGRVQWATGNFWTWLAGAELAQALMLSHVRSCEAAYLWSGLRFPDQIGASVLSIVDSLKNEGLTLVAAAWRSLYSQLVGRFAGWRKIWKDTTSQQQFGRWAAWLEADPESGKIVQHRSVAGRVQRLADRTDTSDSVPLLFACVTAQCRYIVSRLVDLAGHENCLAIEADSVWLTTAGWQALQRRASEAGMAPDNLQTKDLFDRVWMTGKAIAVVEQDGKRFLRCPGVPSDIAVGSDGRVSWPQSEGWAKDGEPNRKRGVRRNERRYSADEIVRLYSTPAKRLPFSEEVNDPMLGEELLQPLGGRCRAPEENE